MKYRGMKTWLKKSVAAYLATGFIAIVPTVGQAAPEATALPTGLTSDTVTQSVADAVMTVNGSADNNVANWESFSIGKDATVNFQDGKNFLNLVNGSNMSEIYGKMNGSGNIYLINPNGILFGDSAQVNVGQLHLSTHEIGDKGAWGDFVGNDNQIIHNANVKADIINLGHIQANYVLADGINVSFKNKADIVDAAGKSLAAYEGDDGHLIVRTTADGHINIGQGGGKDASGYNVKGFNLNPDDPWQWHNPNYCDLITNEAELQAMTLAPTEQGGGKYMLANDITLTEDWTSKGDSREAFSGVFDGLNYTVSGMKGSNGMFGATNGATVMNLNLAEVDVVGANGVGAVVGQATNTTINNVNILSGSVKGVGDVGGLVGNAKESTFSKVSNAANIENTSKAGGSNFGGVVGYVAHTSIDKASNAGQLNIVGEEATADNGWAIVVTNAGGIAGKIDANAEGEASAITNSKNDGFIGTKCVNSVGGISGYSQDGTIQHNANNNKISGNANVGGIVGEMYGGALKENYNTGEIEGSEKIASIAGTAGWATIDSNYNVGKINNPWYQTAGNIIASNGGDNSATVTNSYYATETASGEELPDHDNGYGEAKDYATVKKFIDKLNGIESGGGDDPAADPDADSSKPTLLPTGWESNNNVVVDDGTTNTLGITSSDTNNVINWQTYSIGEGNKVAYDNKNYLNIVNGNLSTEIYGILTAEGNVYILNPNGILVGDKAYINVGSLGLSARTGAADIDSFNNGGNPFGNTAADAAGNIVVLGTKKLNLNGEDAVLTLEGNNVTVKDAKGVKAAGKLIKAKGYVHIGNDADKTLTATALNGTTAKAESIGTKNALDGIAYYELIDASELDAKLYGSGNFMIKGDGAIFPGYGAWHGDADSYGVKDVKIDGLGYTVSGLDANNAGSGWCGTGLIRGGANIDIENVKFTDVNVHSGAGYTGALIGNAKDVIIRNVYVGGTVTSDNLDRNTGVGGFIGNASGNIYIENSANEANIIGADGKGSGYGGLVGTLADGTLIIKNAYNTGNITAESDIAGIVGSSAGTADISNVYTTFGEVANGSVSLSNAYSLSGEAAHKIDSYSGFDISSKADSSKVWRIYDGVSAPMLVSLFKGTVTAKTEGTQSVPLQYDGKGHSLKDAGVTVTYDKADAADYGGEVKHTAAGTYTGNNVSSSQLGYNVVDNTTMDIGKKNITFGVVHKVSDHTDVVNAGDATFEGVIDGDNVTLDVSKATATISSTDINADASWNLLEGKDYHKVEYHNATLTGADAGNYELQTDGDVVVGLGLIREKDNPMEYLPVEEVSEAYNTIGAMQAETSNGEEPAVVVVSTSSAATVAGEPSAVSVENGETMKVDPKQSVHDNRDGEKNGKDKKNKK